MTGWQRFSAWIESGNGIATVIGAAVALLVTVKKFGASILRGCKKLIALARFALSIDEKHEAIIGRLDTLDRGQLDIIQTRSALMDSDERAGFFRANSKGEYMWVSELWRNITGLSGEEATGFGWEISIEESDRPRVVQNWQLAIAHSRRYQDVVSYCHKHTGRITKAKVIATPVRNNDGTVLSWTGVVKPLP